MVSMSSLSNYKFPSLAMTSFHVSFVAVWVSTMALVNHYTSGTGWLIVTVVVTVAISLTHYMLAQRHGSKSAKVEANLEASKYFMTIQAERKGRAA